MSTRRVTRRTALAAGGLAAGGLVTAPFAKHVFRSKQPVFIARHQRYDGQLVRTIADGLRMCDVVPESLRGLRVLLKPNLVEPTRDIPHMTTHPAIILAAAEVFRSWGADVAVGEAPGHVRDTELALVESGIAESLATEQLPFRDLNYEPAVWRKNRGRYSQLRGLYFPQSVVEADLVVSNTKNKTNQLVGM
jgi:uncharacterized protein (DUF362 family)